eukprot:6853558-Ditylum_brightwellii.AAC.1
MQNATISNTVGNRPCCLLWSFLNLLRQPQHTFLLCKEGDSADLTQLPNNQQKEAIFYPVANYMKRDDIRVVTGAPLLPPLELP